jgi:hypothetical protein
MESALMPHPSAAMLGCDLESDDAVYILVITDLTESRTVYYAGKHGALRLIKERLDSLSDVPEARIRHRESSPAAPHSTMGKLPPVTILGESKILQIPQIAQIRQTLPKRFLHRNWEMLWQLSTDGCSFASMYGKLHKIEPAVLILKTDSDEILGAYLSQGLKNSKRYYGSGETFVFGFSPQFKSYHWQGAATNALFISSSTDGIAIGGGGTVAIWIGVDMLQGHSEPCSTFGSKPLTTRPNFRIIDLEVWKIIGGSRQLIRSCSG